MRSAHRVRRSVVGRWPRRRPHPQGLGPYNGMVALRVKLLAAPTLPPIPTLTENQWINREQRWVAIKTSPTHKQAKAQHYSTGSDFGPFTLECIARGSEGNT